MACRTDPGPPRCFPGPIREFSFCFVSLLWGCAAVVAADGVLIIGCSRQIFFLGAWFFSQPKVDFVHTTAVVEQNPVSVEVSTFNVFYNRRDLVLKNLRRHFDKTILDEKNPVWVERNNSRSAWAHVADSHWQLGGSLCVFFSGSSFFPLLVTFFFLVLLIFIVSLGGLHFSPYLSLHPPTRSKRVWGDRFSPDCLLVADKSGGGF